MAVWSPSVCLPHPAPCNWQVEFDAASQSPIDAWVSTLWEARDKESWSGAPELDFLWLVGKFRSEVLQEPQRIMRGMSPLLSAKVFQEGCLVEHHLESDQVGRRDDIWSSNIFSCMFFTSHFLKIAKY
jgi:hypothetical protein